MKSHSIADIIDIARHAPSGDNLQPWRFEKKDDHTIQLFYTVPPVQEPLYFFTGTYASIGMMITYVTRAASCFGYTVNTVTQQHFHPEHNPHAATFTFTKAQEQCTDLDATACIRVLTQRATVRTPYQKTSIPQEIHARLDNVVQAEGAAMTWISDTAQRRTAIRALAHAEQFFWHTPAARKALMESLYVKAKNPKRAYGMPVSTLGVGPIAPLTIPFFQLAEKIPFLWHMIALQSTLATARGIMNAAEIGFICVPRTAPAQMIEKGWNGYDHIIGGQASAQLWLEATAHNLVLQPLYPFVAMAAHEGNNALGPRFMQKHTNVIRFLRATLPHYDTNTLVFAFRIGYSKESRMPEPETTRFQVDHLLAT